MISPRIAISGNTPLTTIFLRKRITEINYRATAWPPILTPEILIRMGAAALRYGLVGLLRTHFMNNVATIGTKEARRAPMCTCVYTTRLSGPHDGKEGIFVSQFGIFKRVRQYLISRLNQIHGSRNSRVSAKLCFLIGAHSLSR